MIPIYMQHPVGQPIMPGIGGEPPIPPPPALHPKTEEYLSRLNETYTSAEISALDTFVLALDGASILNKYDIMYLPFFARSMDDSRVNFASSSYLATVVGTPTHAHKVGWSNMAAGSYFNTHLAPNAASLFSRNNGHIASWSNAVSTAGTDGGVENCFTLNRTNNVLGRLNSGANIGANLGAAMRHVCVCRQVDFFHLIYADAVHFADGFHTSNAPSNTTMYVGRRGDTSESPGLTKIIRAWHFGAFLETADLEVLVPALTDLYNAIQ